MPQETKTVEKDRPKEDREKMLEEENVALKEKYEQRIAALERLVSQTARANERTGAETASGGDTDALLRTIVSEINALKEKVSEGGSVEQLLREATGLAIGFASDSKLAKAGGFTTGVDTAVMRTQLERGLKGELSLGEAMNVIDNAWSIVKGYTLAEEGLKKTIVEVDKEKRQSIKKIRDDILNEDL